MAMHSIIESLGVYIPEGHLSTEEVLQGCVCRPKIDLEELTGINNRPVVGKGEYSLELATKAITQCLKLSRHSPADIDMLVSCSISRYCGPDFKYLTEPSVAAKLAAEIGFNPSAITFDITNACAGMFTGIILADSLIKSGSIRRAMVVSGEFITHIMSNAQKEIGEGIDPQLASLTVGDAGAALILEATDNSSLGFEFIDIYTWAEKSDLCIGTMSDKEHGGYVMYTDSQTMFSLLPHWADNNARILKEHHIEVNDYDYFMTNQVASRFIETSLQLLTKCLDTTSIPPEKVIDDVRYRANTASTTHFVALWDYISKGIIKPYNKIFIGITASGIGTGCASYTFDDLPDRIYRFMNGADKRSAFSRGTRHGK
jgi:3-oxoacyl-[acyl-carrier-protein] synthase III